MEPLTQPAAGAFLACNRRAFGNKLCEREFRRLNMEGQGGGVSLILGDSSRYRKEQRQRERVQKRKRKERAKNCIPMQEGEMEKLTANCEVGWAG